MPELPNPKQEFFCQEYLADANFNAKQAAIRAGYSKDTAESQGSRLLRNVKVLTRIEELKQARTKRTNITADMVVAELAAVGFARIDDIVTIERNKNRRVGQPSKLVEVKATKDMKESTVRAISSIEQGKDGIKVKVHDKVKALELLGKHTGAFEQDNKQKSAITVKKVGYGTDDEG